MDQARVWTEHERERRKKSGSSPGSASTLLCDLGKPFALSEPLSPFVQTRGLEKTSSEDLFSCNIPCFLLTLC